MTESVAMRVRTRPRSVGVGNIRQQSRVSCARILALWTLPTRTQHRFPKASGKDTSCAKYEMPLRSSTPPTLSDSQT